MHVHSKSYVYSVLCVVITVSVCQKPITLLITVSLDMGIYIQKPIYTYTYIYIFKNTLCCDNNMHMSKANCILITFSLYMGMRIQ